MSTSTAIGIVSIITLISKFTGFAREMVIAKSYGAGVVTDAFSVAQGAPNLIFLSIGTALATVLVPVFTQNLKEGGKNSAFSFINKLTSITLIVTCVISVLGVIFAPWVVRFFAPGFADQAYDLSVRMTRIMFPGLIFTALAFLANGVLQSLGQFKVPASMSLPMNLIVITAVLFLSNKFGANVLAWAMLAGIASQFLIQCPVLYKSGYRFNWQVDLQDPSICQVGKLITPVLLGTAILQVNTLVDRMFASNLPVGSISVLDYSNKLVTLVVGIIITPIATVVLPKFSQLVVVKENDRLADLVGRALSVLNLLIIPMAAGLIILRIPIVRFVYERGAFTSEATELTATVLLFGSMGLIGIGMREIAARAFYALKDTVTPMVNGVIAMLVNVALLFLFVGKLKWGVAGMAFASSCSFLVAGVLLTILLYKKIGSIGLRSALSSLWRCCLATAVMAGCVQPLFSKLTVLIPGTGFLEQLVVLFVTIISGVLIYVLGLILLNTRETRYGWVMLRSMIKKQP